MWLYLAKIQRKIISKNYTSFYEYPKKEVCKNMQSIKIKKSIKISSYSGGYNKKKKIFWLLWKFNLCFLNNLFLNTKNFFLSTVFNSFRYLYNKDLCRFIILKRLYEAKK